jgi:hypothetical protein
VQVTVKADFKAVLKALRGLEKQAPFATSLALNKTAAKVREHVKEHLRDTMHIRNKWTEKGIGGKGGRPLTSAEKSTKKQLSVAIGSADPYMKSQAKAGVRKKGEGTPRGKSGGGTLAVPTKGLRKSPDALIRKAKWPKQLMLKPKHFIRPVKSGAVILFKRVGKSWVGKGKKRRHGKIVPLWVFVRRVRIGLAKKWKLGPQAKKVIEQVWAREAALAVEKAIRTAR